MGDTLTSFEYASTIPTTPTIGGTLEVSNDHVHLSYGFPSSSLFPIEELTVASEKAIVKEGRKALHYAGGPGIEKINNWIKKHVKKRAVEATAKDILVTAGAGQAIDVISRTVLNPGDEVWVEAPSFFTALRAFELVGAKTRAFPIDESGLQVDLLEVALEDAVLHHRKLPKLVYTMPNFHNPSGIVLSLERRKKLAQLALKYNFYILEDDAYVDLNFDNVLIPSIYSFAPNRVAYVGTFSKIIGPGIRLGWVVGNEELLRNLRIFMFGSQTNPFTQEIIAHLLDELSFDDYLKKIINHYKSQRDVIVQAIEQYFGKHVTYKIPSGGFFLLIEFEQSVDVNDFLLQAFQKGVSVVAGDQFYTDGSGKNQIRLCFTFSNEQQIQKGIERLAQAYFEYLQEK